MKGRRVTHLAAAALLLGACGAGAPQTSGGDTPPELSFSTTPSQTVTSSSGKLRVDVRWSPEVPVKGADAVELTFLDELGNPVDGLSADVVPWMPAHGHGTSIQPVTTSAGPGVLVATPVYLYMSGEWQLRLTLTGTFDDSAIATTQIP